MTASPADAGGGCCARKSDANPYHRRFSSRRSLYTADGERLVRARTWAKRSLSSSPSATKPSWLRTSSATARPINSRATPLKRSLGTGKGSERERRQSRNFSMRQSSCATESSGAAARTAAQSASTCRCASAAPRSKASRKTGTPRSLSSVGSVPVRSMVSIPSTSCTSMPSPAVEFRKANTSSCHRRPRGWSLYQYGFASVSSGSPRRLASTTKAAVAAPASVSTRRRWASTCAHPRTATRRRNRCKPVPSCATAGAPTCRETRQHQPAGRRCRSQSMSP
eukprot:scaffold48753_cov29-Tisochrysis_lutea.AAC.2